MNELGTHLDRIANAGVASITLHPLPDPGRHHRAVARKLTAAAAVCVMVAAVAVAVSVRSHRGQSTQSRSGAPVADASWNVPSESMSPTLEVDDTVSGATHFTDIERFDVVRVRFPAPGNGVPLAGDYGFKRVIGLPGETVQGRDGKVYVDGHPLAEPYLDVVTEDFASVVVPPDAYFLLGDNRDNSKDSRQGGPVRRADIDGIALRITSPAARAGAIPGSPR
jgi:signal peptidase I